jgi:hypothetical protein
MRTDGIMESKGIHRVYEPSPVPTLYVERVADLFGQVPLIPCFLDGNATSTIPHKYSSRQKDAFECGGADGAGPALWPKLRSSDGSPGLRLSSADGQLVSGIPSDLRMVYEWYIHGIYR